MIKISITGSTPLEALASLTAFGMRCMENQPIHTAASAILENETSKRKAESTRQEAAAELPFVPPAPMPVQTIPAPVLPTAPAPIPAPVTTPAAPAAAPVAVPAVPVAEAPSYTLEQLAYAAGALRRAGKADNTSLVALLEQFGVNNITELAPAQYGAMATALRQMGAQL